MPLLYASDAFFQFDSCNHNLMAAAFAFYSDIRTRAQNLPLIAAAGVRFFCRNQIADL